ncbi:hypothetical protein C7R54_28430 [Achromobacter aloeverae]|uniref:Uncharacterized protein n=2 Tax=Achromobacter aloeverae TaxID=1750518 RepID=A0A4Q1HCK5_9BURK|nr:hypothetical protein C7R54_28430 [Achromobacter aloeverae]
MKQGATRAAKEYNKAVIGFTAAEAEMLKLKAKLEGKKREVAYGSKRVDLQKMEEKVAKAEAREHRARENMCAAEKKKYEAFEIKLQGRETSSESARDSEGGSDSGLSPDDSRSERSADDDSISAASASDKGNGFRDVFRSARRSFRRSRTNLVNGANRVLDTACGVARINQSPTQRIQRAFADLLEQLPSAQKESRKSGERKTKATRIKKAVSRPRSAIDKAAKAVHEIVSASNDGSKSSDELASDLRDGLKKLDSAGLYRILVIVKDEQLLGKVKSSKETTSGSDVDENGRSALLPEQQVHSAWELIACAVELECTQRFKEAPLDVLRRQGVRRWVSGGWVAGAVDKQRVAKALGDLHLGTLCELHGNAEPGGAGKIETMEGALDRLVPRWDRPLLRELLRAGSNGRDQPTADAWREAIGSCVTEHAVADCRLIMLDRLRAALAKDPLPGWDLAWDAISLTLKERQVAGDPVGAATELIKRLEEYYSPRLSDPPPDREDPRYDDVKVFTTHFLNLVSSALPAGTAVVAAGARRRQGRRHLPAHAASTSSTALAISSGTGQGQEQLRQAVSKLGEVRVALQSASAGADLEETGLSNMGASRTDRPSGLAGTKPSSPVLRWGGRDRIIAGLKLMHQGREPIRDRGSWVSRAALVVWWAIRDVFSSDVSRQENRNKRRKIRMERDAANLVACIYDRDGYRSPAQVDRRARRLIKSALKCGTSSGKDEMCQAVTEAMKYCNTREVEAALTLLFEDQSALLDPGTSDGGLWGRLRSIGKSMGDSATHVLFGKKRLEEKLARESKTKAHAAEYAGLLLAHVKEQVDEILLHEPLVEWLNALVVHLKPQLMTSDRESYPKAAKATFEKIMIAHVTAGDGVDFDHWIRPALRRMNREARTYLINHYIRRGDKAIKFLKLDDLEGANQIRETEQPFYQYSLGKLGQALMAVQRDAANSASLAGDTSEAPSDSGNESGGEASPMSGPTSTATPPLKVPTGRNIAGRIAVKGATAAGGRASGAAARMITPHF